MKRLPLGIQNLREIVEGGYVYIDKTRYVYDLLHDVKYYFLSRPRRFGKSLLLDTLGEAFSGDRELFKGLWLYDSDYPFPKHPVLRLDMSNIANGTPEILEESLSFELMRRAESECISVSSGSASSLFKSIIEDLHTKYNQKVVVLIDEYDKPILDHLHNAEMAEANRSVIKSFYGILKSMDPYLRLTFITGVSKFTKTSIFSELNNLFDITMVKKYANICGIPVDDLNKHFREHIDHMSSMSDYGHVANLQEEILAWYDGYSWDGETRVINPFSLLSFFLGQRFESFWYTSGTPAFLINMIKDKPESFLALKDLEIRERSMNNFDISSMSLAPLLFQTGYLTVKEKRFVGVTESYLLDMPNREVREAFNMDIIAKFTERDDVFAETAYLNMRESLQTGDLQQLLTVLKSLFAAIPYELHVKHESYYHSIFYAVLRVLGFAIDAEVSVSGGRIDAVLELDDRVYIMEFKYAHCERDASPETKQKLFAEALDDGMKQIKARGYDGKYAGSGKAVVQAAFAFLGRDDIEMCVEAL